MGEGTCTIGQTVVIKGELSAKEDLTIEGRVEGHIDLEQNTITIGPNARIEADVLAKVIALHQAGDRQAAEDLFDAYLPVNRHELRTGIAMRKEILHRRGALATATTRHPVKPLGDIDRHELDGLLARLERRTGRTITELEA